MGITSVFVDPTVGRVGEKSILSAEGAPAGEVRWFLRGVPAGSALEVGARIASPFTPDAPGAYALVAKDVTVTTPAPRWDGDATAAPTDDEATAPQAELVYWVSETIARPVSAGRGMATLSLSTYADQADETRPELVTLAAGQSVTIGPDVLADAELAAILAELKTALSLSTFLGPSVAFLADLWRGLFTHTSTSPVGNVHGAADGTPTPAGSPTTLAGAQSLLTALAADLLAHEADGDAHGEIVLTPLSTAIGSTLAEACAYAAALDRAFVWHMTMTRTVGGDVHGDGFGDHAEGRWREPPRDLPALCALAADLSARLAAHKARGDVGSDAHNGILTAPFLPNPFVEGMTAPGAFAAIGQMVDEFARHVTSFNDAIGPAPATGAHSAKRPTPAITKPNDPVGCARAAEALCLALEAHALDLDAHNGNAALGATRARAGSGEFARWPYALRVSARLDRLLNLASPATPDNRNAAATLWRTFGGWV